MGCLGRLGCLVVLLIGGAVGYWLYGDRVPSLLSRSAEQTADVVSRAAERVGERLDRPASERVETEVAGVPPGRVDAREDSRRDAREWVRLGPSGTPRVDPLRSWRATGAPAYATLDVAQLAVVLAPLRAVFPPSAAAPEIALASDRLLLRTAIARRDFAGGGALGVLIGATLDGVDTLVFAGVFEPVRPGLSQFRIQALTVGDIEIPSRLIPPIARKVRQVTEGAPWRKDTVASRGDTAGIAADALPVPLPKGVSDVRVVNGRATVYRNVVGGVR